MSKQKEPKQEPLLRGAELKHGQKTITFLEYVGSGRKFAKVFDGNYKAPCSGTYVVPTTGIDMTVDITR